MARAVGGLGSGYISYASEAEVGLWAASVRTPVSIF